MMNLYAGALVQSSNGEGQNLTERILRVSKLNGNVITIDIFHPRALPIRRNRVDLEAALASGDTRILDEDPYASLRRPEHEIDERHRELRDRGYEAISSLVERGDEQLFDPQTRGPLVKALAKSIGIPESTIYDLLRRFWQRGIMKNALLPFFNLRGWRNRDPDRKRKKQKKHAVNDEGPLTVQGQVKAGRPSKLSKSTGQSRGINIYESVLKRIRWGIKLFFETKEAKTLREAHQRTLERFFNTGFYQNKDGVMVPALPPAEELPTYPQFTYWYRKEHQPKREVTARQGETRFNLSHRAVLGDASQMAFGPGSIYQIDATVGDVYLVSSLDRSRIIGRPIIYVVIDTFSHLITGISVTLEGPSWVGAMLAIENATADKVAFCKEYGITIEESEWPSCHFPEGFLADRGEMEGYNADNLVNAFNTLVYTTAPYRGDWKSIVEQQIDLLQEKGIRWTPGEVRKRERGTRDYRLDAVLDLHQFRKLMILCALCHNNQHRMERYRKDEYMIADDVEPYPIDLWNWGIENRSGYLRKLPQEIVRMNLLTEYEVVVTFRGIRFQGLYYSCERAISEQWFERAREKGVERRKAVADPRDLSRIYLRTDKGCRLETCCLVDADKTFLRRDLYEALEHFELSKLKREASQSRHQQSRAEFNAGKDKIIAEAKDQTVKALENRGQSNNSRIKGIRGNRSMEREIERKANAWRLGDNESESTLGEVIDMERAKRQKTDNSGYVAPRQPMDKLRRIRERRLQK
jgi:hypothetical protein